MSARGQVVIPKEIRDQLKLDTKTPLAFGTIRNEAIVIRPLDRKGFADWLESLPPVENPPSMEELVEVVRSTRKERAKRGSGHKRSD